MAVSAALHALPFSFALPVLVQPALPLRAPQPEVELWYEAVTALEPTADSAVAEPAPSVSVAAAPASVVKRRELAPPPAPVRSPPAAPAAQPSSASELPEPRPLDEPATATAPSADAPAATAPGAEAPVAAAPPAEASPVVPTGSVASAVASNGVGVDTNAANGAGNGAVAAGNGGRSLSPATPGPELSALRARYLSSLRERVLARREYPRVARRAGLEGTVCLRISVDATGRLAQLRATCAAPAPLLEAALKAVRAAAPFAPLPSALGSELSLELPMVFQLDAG